MTVDVITRKFTQGLLTAYNLDQLFRVDADDEMTLLSAWNSSEFLDMCGFTVGARYLDDAQVYLFSLTTSRSLTDRMVSLQTPPWLQLLGGGATCQDSPRTVAAAHPPEGLSGP